MALKGKTTRKKPIYTSGEIFIIPKGLIKIHKYVFMTAGILFVNEIPFFISLNCNIIFTAVSHIFDRKTTAAFKHFKEIYMYDLKRGFIITTIHVDGEFSPIQAL